MKLLALVLLLSSFSSLILTEVVNSFQQSCPEFFIQNLNTPSDDIIIPTTFPGCQYKMICQRWQDKLMFATVYDTVRRIPVYSAYTFSDGKVKTIHTKQWKFEPQLDYTEGPKEMIDSPKDAGTIFNQAVYSDYIGTGYTKGHVFPCQFAVDQDQADSTFTLTNAAPQTSGSNQKWAAEVETSMIIEIYQMCKLDKVHIVTGVVPGEDWIPIQRDGKEYQEGINIPSHFWSAYCCRNRTDPDKFIARAYITKQESFNLRRPNIHHLNIELTKLYNKKIRFNVFPGLDFKEHKQMKLFTFFGAKNKENSVYKKHEFL